MAIAPMSNRRPIRPYGAFHRSKRRSRVDTLVILEGPARPRGIRRALSAIARLVFRRR
ncbi:MAG: hypothetical protein ABR964_02635 [Tepidisphaeraceae bacterium]